ncbi:MAG: hypothetical protein HY319_16705 [Armatimonadetes bacterium]|nr:hypothetical protein [Armatimonadota bacterium]
MLTTVKTRKEERFLSVLASQSLFDSRDGYRGQSWGRATGQERDVETSLGPDQVSFSAGAFFVSLNEGLGFAWQRLAA